MNDLPGGEDVKAHYGVSANRYPGQRYTDIYLKQHKTGSEPYTEALYSTPTDQTQNMVSTGILKNPWTGEYYETWENQLPPPTTSVNEIPAYQLKQENPQLIWANGGYNHHRPPPGKSEVSGETFNPVSARGGAPVFGASTYMDEIRKQEEEFAARQTFNNRDGTYACDISLHGERPQGYVGLVPRLRPQPYLPPTNDLNKCELHPGVADVTNTTQRHEAKVYARRAALTQGRMAAVDGPEAAVKPSFDPLKPTTRDGQSVPVNHGQLEGHSALIQDKVRPSKKYSRHVPNAPINPHIKSGIVISDTKVRHTLKTAIADNPFRSNPAHLAVGDVMAALSTLKPTLKYVMENPFPCSAVEGPQGEYLVNQQVSDEKDPYQYYGAGATRGDFGPGLIPGQVTSTAHRDKHALQYLPGVSMAPEGVGGSTARVVQKGSRERRMQDYTNPWTPALGNLPSDRSTFIAPVRAKCTPQMADDM